MNASMNSYVSYKWDEKTSSGYRLRYLAHSRPAETCAAVALPLPGRRDAVVVLS